MAELSNALKPLAAAVALAAALPGAHAATWERIIGTMCIEGVPEAAVKKISDAGSDGLTYRVFYKPGADSKGKVRVFREPPTSPAALATCSELQGNLLFEGTIAELKIAKARESTGASQILRIDPDDLYVEMRRTKSNLSPLYGGNLQLGQDGAIANSARTWLRNSEMLIAEDGKPTKGSIDITSWGRLLTGVKALLPGTTQETLIDMDAGNSNVTIRVPFDGGATQLISGTFIAKDTAIKVDMLDLPGASFESYAGSAERIEVAAGKDGVRFTLADMPYKASRATLRAGSSVATATGAEGSIKSIAAAVPRSGAQLTLSHVQVGEVRAKGTGCSHSLQTAVVVSADACAATSAMADASRRRLRLDATNVKSMMGAPMFENAGAAQLTTVAALSGAAQDQFFGRFTEANTRLGSLEMSKQIVDVLNPATANGRIEFPFSFSIPPSQGTWRVHLPEGKVAITGALRTLKGKGVASVDLVRPGDWVVDIGKGDFAFDAGVEVVHEPILYGSKPKFGAVGLRFSTHTPVRVTAAGATGTLLAGADALLVADPVVSLGDDSHAMTLQGPAKFDTGVELAYQLGSGKLEVETGRLLVTSAKLLTKPGQSGDIGEIRLSDGFVSVEQFAANFKEGKGSATLTGLSLVAASLQSKPRADDATAGNQLAWSGKPEGPVTIASAEGGILKDEATRVLKLGDVGIKDLKVQLADVRLGQGNALKFAGGSLTVTLDEYGPEKVAGKLELKNSHLKSTEQTKHGTTTVETAVAALNVNIAGGTPAALNGTGQLVTSYLNLDTDSKIEIKESCDGVPDFDGVPVRANVRSGPVTLNLTVESGGLKGRGVALVTSAKVEDRGKYKCQKRAIDWPVVNEQRASYDYPCPTWRKPFRTCRGWTVVVPEVRVVFDRAIEVRSFQASGFFTAMGITLKGADKIESCGKGGFVTPLADISYYVTPRTSVKLLDKAVKEVIDQTARPFTSAFVSGAGALYGAIMPLTSDGLCL